MGISCSTEQYRGARSRKPLPCGVCSYQVSLVPQRAHGSNVKLFELCVLLSLQLFLIVLHWHVFVYSETYFVTQFTAIGSCVRGNLYLTPPLITYRLNSKVSTSVCALHVCASVCVCVCVCVYLLQCQ